MTDRRKEQASGISPRELALYLMLEVSEKGGYSHIILRDLMGKYQYLEKRDRAFLSRLCEGTLEQQLRMDEVLNRFSSVPVKKMKPVIRNILRLGVPLPKNSSISYERALPPRAPLLRRYLMECTALPKVPGKT